MTTVVDAAPTRPAQAAAPAAAGSRHGVLTKAWTKSLGLAAASALLVVVAFCSIAYGSKPISLGTVIDAFVHFDGSNDHLIVRSLRVPRTVIGLVVGAALGLSGAVMQVLWTVRGPFIAAAAVGRRAGRQLAAAVRAAGRQLRRLGRSVDATRRATRRRLAQSVQPVRAAARRARQAVRQLREGARQSVREARLGVRRRIDGVRRQLRLRRGELNDNEQRPSGP